MNIYGLKNTTDGIIRYIGLTTKPINKRLAEHLSESKKQKTHKDKWITMNINNGSNIVAELIDTAESIDELKDKEKKYIKLFKSFGSKLVNGTDGGDGGTGFKHSEFIKKRISEYKSKKVYVFDYNTKKLISEYTSTLSLVNELNLTRSLVIDVLSKKKSHYKGYFFNHEPFFVDIKVNKKTKNVWNKNKSTIGLQKFKTTSIILSKDCSILEFNTTKECAEFLKVSHSYIIKCKKTNKKINGYTIH